ncbi:MAG: M20/M25/M40 family metallo-hydrolase [Bacteroidales bacterium]|nr:M20/M25/M40 family metallo-hydrolase [Bacteroidales bacterium]
MKDIPQYINDAYDLLKKMVSIPSVSFEEKEVSDMLCNYLEKKGITVQREGNNLIATVNEGAREHTLLLNSHIDTVPAAEGYTFDPINPPQDEEIIYGLGSNDAGASVVSMIETFLYFAGNPEKCPVGLCLALSTQEERMGDGGMISIAPLLAQKADYAIIGEPTDMKAAIAERGLLVIDAYASGVSAHVAHSHLGDNALLKAVKDITTLQNFRFEKESPLMGPTTLNVTQIDGGTAHNIIPDKCHFVIDIRPTDKYTNEEILSLLQKEVSSTLKPRNLKNKTSATPARHILSETAEKLGAPLVVSQTTSDWMRINIPAIKMGPGSTNRSHKADEFVYKKEIASAIEFYINFIENLK